MIGGCSAHNGCAQSVGWRGDYDRWASVVVGKCIADMIVLDET